MSLSLVSASLWAGPPDALQSQLLTILAQWANEDGGSCYPSIELMAKFTRRSDRQVQRAIKGLVAQKWLFIEKKGNGRGHLTEYVLNADRLVSAGAKEQSDWRKKHPIRPRYPSSERATSMSPIPDKAIPVKGDIGQPERVTSEPIKGDIYGDIEYKYIELNTGPSSLSLGSSKGKPREGVSERSEPPASQSEKPEPLPSNLTSQKPFPPAGPGDPPELARQLWCAYPKNSHRRPDERLVNEVALLLPIIRDEAIVAKTDQTDAALMLIEQVQAIAAAVRGTEHERFLPAPERFFQERRYRQAPQQFTRNVNGGKLNELSIAERYNRAKNLLMAD